jgi:membrane dipeptidase
MSQLIIDAHLDLAFNAIQVGRDLTVPATTVRTQDGEPVMRSFGSCTTTLPDLRRGHVGIVFGTVMSRTDASDEWTRTGMYCQDQCYGVGRGHVAYYQALERDGLVRLIHNTSDLNEMLEAWQNPTPSTPIGLVLAMESADPILDPENVEEWRDLGLKMVSLSHYGTRSDSHGTATEGGLLPRAKPLLDALAEAKIIVDMTHTTDQAFWEILDIYDGPIAASHHNCRALVPGQRQLTDDMIKAIIERDGVIGAAFDAWMLDPAFQRGKPACEQTMSVTLEAVVDHIDHIAQLAGNARHSGIGTDLDGGFGAEQSPRDLNTIADLQRLPDLLESRGYTAEDITGLLSGNWVRLITRTWEGK